MCHAKRLLELPNSNLIEAVRWIINLFPREHKAHWTGQRRERDQWNTEGGKRRQRWRECRGSALPASASVPWTLPGSQPPYNTVRAWCHAPHHHPGNGSTCACLCAERNKEINLLTTEHKRECEKGQRQENKTKNKGNQSISRRKAPWEDGWVCRYYCHSWRTQPTQRGLFNVWL